MGYQDVDRHVDPERLRAFSREVLKDLRALGRMERQGVFETGVRRIGAEQEMFLVDEEGLPAPLAMEILDTADEPNLTTELGKFNLELNLDPVRFQGDCLRALEGQLDERLDRVRGAARVLGAEVILVGILPSLSPRHLTLDWMAPVPRYYALNEAFRRLRGDRPFRFRIVGRDELIGRHDNVMFEACNTSFQVHLQVAADEFARCYNLAQLLAAPTLAAATNSPLLFGRHLWRETRIAVFEQSVDTRASSHLREQAGRVSFGRSWVESSVTEVFEEDLARFRSILAVDIDEDALAVLEAGKIPKLKALSLFNGTVYRWNRPCYGITEGKPHLRIENRVLPSGPTTLDEMANGALWLGAMTGMVDEYGNIRERMDFRHARDNFISCARRGLGAEIDWPGLGEVPVVKVLLDEILPAARRGLAHQGIATEDVDRYLGVMEERIQTRRTGSQWQIDALEALAPRLGRGAVFRSLTRGIVARQFDGRPVHEWRPMQADESADEPGACQRVEDVMSTDLFTLNEDDVVDLAAAVMKWRHIRRIPVEDGGGKLVGLVTYRGILRLMSRGAEVAGKPIPISAIMQTELVTVRPETPTIEAARMMKDLRVGCLPVVDGEQLVGIITEHDLMRISWPLLERHLDQHPVGR